MKTIKVGSDFSGVGAFDYAIKRVSEQNGFEVRNLFACDLDKWVKKSYFANHPKPEKWFNDVYEREIPDESLDIFMSSPPCQSFSMAGHRRTKEEDKRGILFFNTHEFIQKNNPRFFILENVRGLLSHEEGKTFQEWLNLLGGKSVNGLSVLFPEEDAVQYHIYWKVMNAKEFNIPQNRERVFIVGVRDDEDNSFLFPKEERLTRRLKDILDDEVPAKYNLSKKLIEGFVKHNANHLEKGTGFFFLPKTGDEIANSLRANGALNATDNTIHVHSATSRGFEEATDGDSINFCEPSSTTRRGRVGKQIAQTIQTESKLAVVQLNPSKESGGKQPFQQNRIYDKDGISPALNSGQSVWGGNIVNTWNLRRLTPRESFRLMDFPEEFKFVVSDSQLYKQAGNSIVVKCLERIIQKLPL